MRIDIVTHAYGPFYITLLAEQLRSMKNRDNVTAIVFYSLHEGHLLSDAVGDLNGSPDIAWCPLGNPRLLNRTIGRNIAAKNSAADWVWFTDCDYLFGPGSIEAVTKLDPHAACMYYPRIVHKTTYFYDDEPLFDAARTEPAKQRRAIGGIQIVPGHLARQYGYLDGVTRWLKPAMGDTMGGWAADKAYRGWLSEKTGLPIVAADIPNVYRLRHRIPETSDRAHLLPMESK